MPLHPLALFYCHHRLLQFQKHPWMYLFVICLPTGCVLARRQAGSVLFPALSPVLEHALIPLGSVCVR